MKASGIGDTPHGPTADGRATRTRVPANEARVLYRRLTAAGLDSARAGNLTAVAFGLRPTRVAWSMGEISALLFLRELVQRDLIAR